MRLPTKIAAALCAAMAISGAASAAAPERQIEALAKTAMVHGGWFVLPERDRDADAWRYAIADLDRNGRLEVVKVKRGWAEGGPMLLVKELEEDGERLRGEAHFDGTDIPDILAASDTSGQAPVLCDAKHNLFHYIFQATVYHGEFASVTTKYALTFSDGTLLVRPLARFHWNMSGYDGSVKTRYDLPNTGEDIDANRYENIEREAFPGCEARTVTFLWRSAEELKTAASNGELRQALADSFACFQR
ncbi:MAG: hypothetical protein IJ521_04865 [Schwartzia sp.]|nr:hypothetical protein [Schwartzia sp. (in: firmicutes)]